MTIMIFLNAMYYFVRYSSSCTEEMQWRYLYISGGNPTTVFQCLEINCMKVTGSVNQYGKVKMTIETKDDYVQTFNSS